MAQLTSTQKAENFPGLPPFPDDVPTAPLLRLSLAKLLAGDAAEYERLFEASIDIGFFYLDLQDSEQGRSLLLDADDLFQVGDKLFQLPLEEKKQYDFSAQDSYFGYKGQGVAVVDKQGNLDRNEFYNVSRFLRALGNTPARTLAVSANVNLNRSPKTISWVYPSSFQRQIFCRIAEPDFAHS